MAAALIRIDQASHPTTPTGLAGRSRDDIVLNSLVTLNNQDNTGVRSWRWEIIDQPNVTTPIALSDPTSPVPTFTPVDEGSYLIQLTVNEGRRGEVQRLIVAIRDAAGNRVPAAGEQAEANWDDASGNPNPRGWQPEMRRIIEAAGGGGWEQVYLGDFTAAPATDLAAGTNTTVVVDGVTWTSNVGDTNPNTAQGTVTSFATNSNGLDFVGFGAANNMIPTSHQAAHVFAEWEDLLGRQPKIGASYAILARVQGIASIDAAVNASAVGVASYTENDGSGAPGTDPTTDEKRAYVALETISGNARLATREGSLDLGWRDVPSGGSPAPVNDVIAMIFHTGVKIGAGVGDYGTDQFPDPSDLTLKGRTWLGAQLGFTDVEYLDPSDRIALFFQTAIGATYSANITHVAVYERL